MHRAEHTAQSRAYSAEQTGQSIQRRADRAEHMAQSIQHRVDRAEHTVQSIQRGADRAEQTAHSRAQCRVDNTRRAEQTGQRRENSLWGAAEAGVALAASRLTQKTYMDTLSGHFKTAPLLTHALC